MILIKLIDFNNLLIKDYFGYLKRDLIWADPVDNDNGE